MTTCLFDNNKIAASFSRSASVYRQYAKLQEQSAAALLAWENGAARLTEQCTLLDIGAGPGTDFSALLPQQVIAVDIALGMLTELKTQFNHYYAIAGDACDLPLLNNSVDAIYSNLALQWCGNYQNAFSEIYRVLKPNGFAQLAVVVAGSLPQLSQLQLGIYPFTGVKNIVHDLALCSWQTQHLKQVTLTCYFDELKALLYSIKGVGASITPSHAKAEQGLKGKAHWQQLVQQADNLRMPQGIPLSYQILMIQLQK